MTSIVKLKIVYINQLVFTFVVLRLNVKLLIIASQNIMGLFQCFILVFVSKVYLVGINIKINMDR